MTSRVGFYLFVTMGLVALVLALEPVEKTEAVTRSEATAEIQARTCRYQGLQRGSWTEREVRATIRCAAERWPVDLGTALHVAARESGFRARARNPYSGACGVFQHLPRYWPGRVTGFARHTGPRFEVYHRSCFNARANVLVSIRMAHLGGWGPWGL